MRYSSPIFLFFTLTVLPCDAMVGALDVTRLPNCYDTRLVRYAMQKQLDNANIEYRSSSVKLVRVTTQRYQILPEKWICQGILAFQHQGVMVQQPFIYHITWTTTFPRRVNFQATFLVE